MNFRAVITIVALIAISPVTKASDTSQNEALPVQSSAKLRGVVLDPQEARIVRAVITIQRKSFITKIASSETGEFEKELPGGLYKITIEADGFRAFQENSYRINDGETREITVHLQTDSTTHVTPNDPYFSAVIIPEAISPRLCEKIMGRKIKGEGEFIQKQIPKMRRRRP